MFRGSLCACIRISILGRRNWSRLDRYSPRPETTITILHSISIGSNFATILPVAHPLHPLPPLFFVPFAPWLNLSFAVFLRRQTSERTTILLTKRMEEKQELGRAGTVKIYTVRSRRDDGTKRWTKRRERNGFVFFSFFIYFLFPKGVRSRHALPPGVVVLIIIYNTRIRVLGRVSDPFRFDGIPIEACFKRRNCTTRNSFESFILSCKDYLS